MCTTNSHFLISIIISGIVIEDVAPFCIFLSPQGRDQQWITNSRQRIRWGFWYNLVASTDGGSLFITEIDGNGDNGDNGDNAGSNEGSGGAIIMVMEWTCL